MDVFKIVSPSFYTLFGVIARVVSMHHADQLIFLFYASQFGSELHAAPNSIVGAL